MHKIRGEGDCPPGHFQIDRHHNKGQHCQVRGGGGVLLLLCKQAVEFRTFSSSVRQIRSCICSNFSTCFISRHLCTLLRHPFSLRSNLTAVALHHPEEILWFGSGWEPGSRSFLHFQSKTALFVDFLETGFVFLLL